MKQRIISLFLILCTIFTLTGCNSVNYKKAMSMYESEQYGEAEIAFAALGDYENSAEMVLECKYRQAIELYKNDSYEDAVTIFADIADYKDSQEKISELCYTNTYILRVQYAVSTAPIDIDEETTNGNTTILAAFNSEKELISATTQYYRYLSDNCGLSLVSHSFEDITEYKFESSDGKVIELKSGVLDFSYWGNPTVTYLMIIGIDNT